MNVDLLRSETEGCGRDGGIARLPLGARPDVAAIGFHVSDTVERLHAGARRKRQLLHGSARLRSTTPRTEWAHLSSKPATLPPNTGDLAAFTATGFTSGSSATSVARLVYTPCPISDFPMTTVVRSPRSDAHKSIGLERHAVPVDSRAASTLGDPDGHAKCCADRAGADEEAAAPQVPGRGASRCSHGASPGICDRMLRTGLLQAIEVQVSGTPPHQLRVRRSICELSTAQNGATNGSDNSGIRCARSGGSSGDGSDVARGGRCHGWRENRR